MNLCAREWPGRSGKGKGVMKNMKKMVAFGMTAILGASMLAGCGSSSDGSSDEKSGSSKGKTELTFGIRSEEHTSELQSP